MPSLESASIVSSIEGKDGPSLPPLPQSPSKSQIMIVAPTRGQQSGPTTPQHQSQQKQKKYEPPKPKQLTPAQQYRQMLANMTDQEREIWRLELRWKKNKEKWVVSVCFGNINPTMKGSWINPCVCVCVLPA